MSHVVQQKWKGWDVVWINNKKEIINLHHLSHLPKDFMPSVHNVKTRCRKRVYCPVMHTAEYERELREGHKNCADCFA